MTRDAGEVSDCSRPYAYARLEQRFARLEPSEHWRFDELVVDEGQDFQQEGVAALMRLLNPDGRACGWKTRCRTSTPANRCACPAGW